MKKVILTVEFICEVSDDADIDNLCLDIFDYSSVCVGDTSSQDEVGVVVGHETVDPREVTDEDE